MFLPHFIIFCDLLLNSPTAPWNLFVLRKKKKSENINSDIIIDLMHLASNIS